MPTTQQPWYSGYVTQRYGQHGEQGIDLAESFHTPITSLYAGTVKSAAYTQYGSDLQIAIDGTNWQEEFLHNDVLTVGVGQHVTPGQVVGLSGGETPAQAVGLIGAQHPAYTGSTGPHVEFDLSQNGNYFDPAKVIAAASQGLPVATMPIAAPVGGSSGGSPVPGSWLANALQAAFPGLYTASETTAGLALGGPQAVLQGAQQGAQQLTGGASGLPASLGTDIGNGIAAGFSQAFASLWSRLAAGFVDFEIRSTLVVVGVLVFLLVLAWLLLGAASSPRGQTAVKLGMAAAA